MFYNYSPEYRAYIKKQYDEIMEDLLNGVNIDPYAIVKFSWIDFMSPIERNMWNTLRTKGIKMYPQVPCGKYFIDFASPYEGVALEVDGKMWHLDKEKDRIREEYIKANGYPIFHRYTGRQTYLIENDGMDLLQDDLDMEDYQQWDMAYE